MTHDFRMYVERYIHTCGAPYNRAVLAEAPKRFQINTCHKCYQFMANTDKNGCAFFYDAVDADARGAKQELVSS